MHQFLFPLNPSFVNLNFILNLKTGGLLRDTFKELQKNAWASSVNKPFHARTTKLVGTLKKWCKKKKTFTAAP
jgi:hypothetical protein